MLVSVDFADAGTKSGTHRLGANHMNQTAIEWSQTVIGVLVVALLVFGLALVPVTLWMLFSGKLQELSYGDLKIVSAIREQLLSSTSTYDFGRRSVPMSNSFVPASFLVSVVNPCRFARRGAPKARHDITR